MPNATLLDFQQTQRQLINYIRDPSQQPPLAGVAVERLRLYRDLTYHNIEDFISNGFPILYSIYSDAAWTELINDFIACHRAQSPLCRKICEEFIAFLQHERDDPHDPPFLLELAHYEWAEVILEQTEVVHNYTPIDPTASLLTSQCTISPLVWILQYQFPVHKIGVNYQPTLASATPTFILLYRQEQDDTVKFMTVNAITARIVQLLQQNRWTGQQVLDVIVAELAHPKPLVIHERGQDTLIMLRNQGIIVNEKRYNSSIISGTAKNSNFLKTDNREQSSHESC